MLVQAKHRGGSQRDWEHRTLRSFLTEDRALLEDQSEVCRGQGDLWPSHQGTGDLSLHGHAELNSANNQTDLRREFFPESLMQLMSVLAFG